MTFAALPSANSRTFVPAMTITSAVDRARPAHISMSDYSFAWYNSLGCIKCPTFHISLYPTIKMYKHYLASYENCISYLLQTRAF
jgi:hypothetical protein